MNPSSSTLDIEIDSDAKDFNYKKKKVFFVSMNEYNKNAIFKMWFYILSLLE